MASSGNLVALLILAFVKAKILEEMWHGDVNNIISSNQNVFHNDFVT